MTEIKGKTLNDILASIDHGETQLPDFQRGWVWEDLRIRALIASLTNNYPIGAAMLLDNSGGNLHFKHRVIEGADKSLENVNPRYLILDGQQRFTSLYRALICKSPVETTDDKKKPLKRYYYLHIPTCLNTTTDRIDGVLSVPENRILTENIGRDIKLDLSSIENEFANHYFPLNIVFDAMEMMKWGFAYTSFHGTPETTNSWMEFQVNILTTIHQYTIPLIILPNNISKGAVCQVFENVNGGGG